MKKEGTVENIYNVSANVSKAALIVIAQVDVYRVQVSVTLTSACMREEPTVDQAKGEAAELARLPVGGTGICPL